MKLRISKRITMGDKTIEIDVEVDIPESIVYGEEALTGIIERIVKSLAGPKSES